MGSVSPLVGVSFLQQITDLTKKRGAGKSWNKLQDSTAEFAVNAEKNFFVLSLRRSAISAEGIYKEVEFLGRQSLKALKGRKKHRDIFTSRHFNL